MSDEIQIRTEGRAGRITLNRPGALNALTWDMCARIDAALREWEGDPNIALLIVDGGTESRAFCAGGDLAEMYQTGKAGDFDYGRRFWTDEYRMNARLFEFPKPVVTFLHGFTMGGGVGVGCHGSHRVVCEDSRIAMPECKVGLIPDVGGSLILARAPGRLGEYLAVTSGRMGPGDAIHAGFADYFIPREHWPALIETLCETADWQAVDRCAQPAPVAPLVQAQDEIDALFGGETLRDVLTLLECTDSDLASSARKAISGNSPISMACALELVHRVRLRPDAIRHALALEYRFTYRAMEHGDFLEGIRAIIIDKDNAPRWRHDAPAAPGRAEVGRMLQPLGDAALTF